MIPATGVVGFKLLESTETAQRAAFDQRPDLAREVDYFKSKIADVRTAADFVADRRLMAVGLGAFGLEDKVDQKAFVRKILEEGSENSEALANKLIDPRFARFARAFGFGDLLGARTGDLGFGEAIGSVFLERSFEIEVGNQNEALRLALNFRREIKVHANASDPEGAAWFSVMGDLPVREVFESAFGLSGGFGQLDLDRQRDELRELNDREFGSRSLAVFNDDEKVSEIINRFLARRSIEDGPGPGTRGVAALTVLGGGIGASALQNLITSAR